MASSRWAKVFAVGKKLATVLQATPPSVGDSTVTKSAPSFRATLETAFRTSAVRKVAKLANPLTVRLGLASVRLLWLRPIFGLPNKQKPALLQAPPGFSIAGRAACGVGLSGGWLTPPGAPAVADCNAICASSEFTAA